MSIPCCSLAAAASQRPSVRADGHASFSRRRIRAAYVIFDLTWNFVPPQRRRSSDVALTLLLLLSTGFALALSPSVAALPPPPPPLPLHCLSACVALSMPCFLSPRSKGSPDNFNALYFFKPVVDQQQ